MGGRTEDLPKTMSVTIQRTTDHGPRTHETPRAPKTLDEAARQFEQVLAQQLVRVMTEGLFDESLGGESSPGWMSGQRAMQRDQMTTLLAEHLADTGTLGIAEMLLRQWQRTGAAPPDLDPSD